MKKNLIIINCLMILQGLSIQAAACPKPVKAPTSTKQTIKKKVMVAFTEADIKSRSGSKKVNPDSPLGRQLERAASVLDESIPDEIAATP